MLGFPWNTADLAPEALLQMVDEMEQVAALLLALVGSEQDADVVRQLQTTFLLLDATYPTTARRSARTPPHARTRERNRPAPAGVTKLRHVHSPARRHRRPCSAGTSPPSRRCFATLPTAWSDPTLGPLPRQWRAPGPGRTAPPARHRRRRRRPPRSSSCSPHCPAPADTVTTSPAAAPTPNCARGYKTPPNDANPVVRHSDLTAPPAGRSPLRAPSALSLPRPQQQGPCHRTLGRGGPAAPAEPRRATRAAVSRSRPGTDAPPEPESARAR